mmetsp:Transcript_26358/g.55638  ORF Transcript_26358/g.55638 Transcript_26358/m.55638 type:complete len:210 (+) Transcript_26358:99-728(+)
MEGRKGRWVPKEAEGRLCGVAPPQSQRKAGPAAFVVAAVTAARAHASSSRDQSSPRYRAVVVASLAEGISSNRRMVAADPLFSLLVRLAWPRLAMVVPMSVPVWRMRVVVVAYRPLLPGARLPRAEAGPCPPTASKYPSAYPPTPSPPRFVMRIAPWQCVPVPRRVVLPPPPPVFVVRVPRLRRLWIPFPFVLRVSLVPGLLGFVSTKD